MKNGDFEYSLDVIRYKDTAPSKYIQLSGWCFHHQKEAIDYVVQINGKEVPISQKRIFDRKDLIKFYKDVDLVKDSGYDLKIDVFEPVHEVILIAKTSSESIVIETIGESKLRKIRDTSLIEYSVDCYERNVDSGLSQMWGWAFAVDKSPLQFEVHDAHGHLVAHTFRKQERTDFMEDWQIQSGFYIVFKSDPDAKYTLVIKNEKESKTVDLNKIKSTNQKSLMGYIKSINGQNVKKAGMYLKRKGFKAFVRRIRRGPQDEKVSYNTYFHLHEPTKEELDRQRKHVFSYQPKISLIVATFNTPLNYLKEMIETVTNQTYANWELCIADGSTNDEVEKYVKDHYAQDDKIRFVRLQENYGISGNMNAAMDIATGDFIALYDHDDTLTLDALYENVRVLNENSNIEFIYSDEDKMDSEGERFFEPHFKPDFNYDLLCSTNYICHFLVVKKSLIDQVGKLRKEFDGAQDFDFVLRLSDACGPEKIHHIPKVLYHWRFHQNSTAANPESKMYAFEAGKKAVQAFYDAKGIHATVEHGASLGIYRTKYILDSHPKVSIIIPNKDHVDDLSRCINSIEAKSTYDNYEYIIVENNSTEQSTFDYYKELIHQNSKVKVVTWKDEFNYSAINNFGTKYASGDYYLLLNNDTEVITPEFIEELLGYCMRKDVGAVGARLYYPDDTIQHAGVIVGLQGIAGHAFVGLERDNPGYFARPMTQQDYSAVTAACMMVDKNIYEEVGGLNEQLKVAFNDIDFCLKIREKGYKIVYNPYCELYHYESKSRGEENTFDKVDRFNGEINYFEKRWHDILANGDPYYNPNLTYKKNDFSLTTE